MFLKITRVGKDDTLILHDEIITIRIFNINTGFLWER